MADRRMISRSVVGSDRFIDMPHTAQLLYYYLSVHADDDGFIGNISTLRRGIGLSEEDVQTLIDMEYLHRFESGVVVILHWRVSNAIRKDRYHPTGYVRELAMLEIDDFGVYRLLGNQMATEERRGKGRSGQVRSGQAKAEARRGAEESVHTDSGQTFPSPTADGTTEPPTAEPPTAEPPTAEQKQTDPNDGYSADSFVPSPSGDPSDPSDAAPTRREVEQFARANGLTHVNIDRFFVHYDKRRWLSASGCPVRWKLRLLDWNSKDRDRAPSSSPHGRAAPYSQSASQSSFRPPNSSFDTDDFFEAALRRSYASPEAGG